ncbi:DUF4251 domain-containing protein [Carboxylicivirga sediminis]|uniref:DUF4251 domain-containing protein n=1 Tax=Carboxylicivirga sediminis TaxID=2006564 RepID=A0A941F2P4_9BACT|nr:DUF4251 domain-containing protein [Carboxylicivirga sediminis]MBR8534260.1 DUF4251 domain-containing protein [Carboxylicivirga sediminis]
MRKLVLITIVLGLSLSVFGQENENKELTRKERREIKKQEQKEQSEAMAKLLAAAIDEQMWVLEANTLAGKRGASVVVNSTLNFIAVEGDEAFVQLGSNTGMGQNGVGGVSVRGNVNKYEVKKNEKKGTYFITLYISSALGSFDIRLDCNSDGQIANASVQGNTSKRIQYRGIIVPLSESSVYKGTPII